MLSVIVMLMAAPHAEAGGHPFGWGWGKGFAKPWVAKGGWGVGGWGLGGWGFRGAVVPPGFVWEAPCAGLHAGFWRPRVRPGFVWIAAQPVPGAPVAGYWSPVDPRPGYVWQPGWFDGRNWVEGSWVRPGPSPAEPAPGGELAIPAR